MAIIPMRKLIAIMALLIPSCSPAEQVQTSPDSSRTPPVAERSVSPVPSLTKNVNTTIYVVNEIPIREWAIPRILGDWNKAKFVDFELVNKCPSEDEACVTLRLGQLQKNDLGLAEFKYSPFSMAITINPKQESIYGAQATICHEFGHILGLGHVTHKGIASCMSIWADWNHPSNFDLWHVNRLGPWDYYEAEETSSKDIDDKGIPR